MTLCVTRLHVAVLGDDGRLDSSVSVSVSQDPGRPESLCRVHRATDIQDRALPSCDTRGTSKEKDELSCCQDNRTHTDGHARTDDRWTASEDMSTPVVTTGQTDDRWTESEDTSTSVVTTVELLDPEVDNHCASTTEQTREPEDAIPTEPDSKPEPTISSTVPETRASEHVMGTHSQEVPVCTENMCDSREDATTTGPGHKSDPQMSTPGLNLVDKPTENSSHVPASASDTVLRAKPSTSNHDSTESVCDSESTTVNSAPTQSQLDDPSQITKSRSSFLDELEAKEYLEKQLYGDSDDVFLSSLGSMSAGSEASGNAGPFVKKLQENLLSYMPASNVQEAVTSWTKNVVSNIRTSIDRFSFTSTEGVCDAEDQGVGDVQEDGDPGDLQVC